MFGFFSPAVALANRMPFSAKLFSVVVIFLIPYLLLLALELANSHREIVRVERQLHGLELVMQLKPMAMDIAQHRGNMAQYLTGATEKEAAIIALENKVDEDLASMLETAKSAGYESELIASLSAQWQPLKLVNSRAALAAKNFMGHSDLVAQIQTALGAVSDAFEMIIQPNAKDHYLENIVAVSMPQLVEELGKLRGKGAAALTDKVITPDERVMLGSMLSATERFGARVDQDVELLFKDPLVQGSLKNANLNAHNALRQFFEMTASQILRAEDVRLAATGYFETGTQAIEAVSALDAQMSEALHDSIKALHREKARENFWLILISLVATGLGLYLSFGILSALNANAGTLRDAAGKLREGDFSAKVSIVSSDTLGEAASGLTAMIGSVAALIHTIQQSAHSVNELSVKLQTVADASKKELDNQHLETQQAASASTEMAATVREVARSCVQVTEATEVARGSAVEGQSRVNEAIEKITALGSDVGQAKEIISQLQSDVTDIGAVLEVIRSIAEQTNLLALNAAIEAARAGDQGRGFAVVADEVRSLAKRTQDSTAEIRAVIETLQARAEKAVTIIHHSYNGAQDSVASAASAGKSLERIVIGVEQLRDLNTQIATAAEQQAAVAEQMSLNTRHLCDSAENIMDQVDKTVTHGASLRKAAVALLENTMKFKT